jgi:hypothetical protein
VLRSRIKDASTAGASVEEMDRRTPRSPVRDLWDHVGMDCADGSEVAGLPIACTLGPGDGAARMQRWEALSARGHPSSRRSGHRLEVRYELEHGIREELEALAAAERQCCVFARWTVSQEDDHVVLHVAVDPGRPDDVAAIAALFGAG